MLDFQSTHDVNISDPLVKSLAKTLESDAVFGYAEELNHELARRLKNLILEVADLTRPSNIYLINGSEKEKASMILEMVNDKTLIELNQKEFPNCYLHRSNPSDVARSEKDSFMCTTTNKDDVGPTNNWMHTEEAKEKLYPLFRNSMNGKTMYVVPYWLGPYDSSYGRAGIEITDSAYVVANLAIITRTGRDALKEMAKSNDFVLGIHATKDLDANNRYICHFPDENDGQGLVMSINTNYGGNALLSKKCHALRISSVRGYREDWMAEHMMLIGIEDPTGEVTYVSGAFPSASGKTNLSMLDPPDRLKKEGWKTSLMSDDIIWLNRKNDRFYAVNPENGFFGVAPHTNYKTNPNAMATISKNTIFTNVALDDKLIPFWEGKNGVPDILYDWQGKRYTGEGPAAHPNSRFTSPSSNYPNLSKDFNNPNGVPVSAFLYGGRRKDLIPLVYESYSWKQGVLIGAMQRVETTAAITGKVGVLRNDPMANKPFVGYNMADYFNHHLKMGASIKKPPKVFNVNWFRKDEQGNFMWPGYSHNTYVIKWIVNRVKDEHFEAAETPIGYVPSLENFDYGTTDREIMKKLLEVDAKGFLSELEEVKPFLQSFGDRFPKELWDEFYKLQGRLEEWK